MSPFWYGQWPVTWFFSNISLGMGTKSVSHIPGGVWWNRLLGSSSCQDLWTVCGPYPEFYWLSILLPGTCLATFNVQVVNTPITLINMKFQDNIWTTKMCPAMQYCDVTTNPRWRTAAILKIDFLAITHRPIVRFQRNFVWGSRTVCKRGLHDKNDKFLKSKMADDRHFKNR